MADFLEKHRKGDFVMVEGRVMSRTWDDAEGRKKTVTEVVIHTLTNHDAVTNRKTEATEDVDSVF